MRTEIPLFLLGLCVQCFAQLPPFPTDTMSDEVAAPVTYQRTVAWNASAGAESYALACGAALVITTNTTASVPLTEGTNNLAVTASNSHGISAASRTNYLILPLRITGCEVLCSSNLLTWTKTNLPPAQTNATGPALMFKLKPTLVTKLDERHVP